jgi:uncharacterized protein YbjT (DUF2867 family)
MTQEYGSQGITLVIGGTGKTGRRVADRLVAASRLVRIGSRTAELAFDWEKQNTWKQVLRGVKAAYVAYQPDLAVPGALGRPPRDFSNYVRQMAATGIWGGN